MTGERSSRFFTFTCLVLAFGTLGLYWPVSHSPFTLLDDADYIYTNPHVTGGLNWNNLAWAFYDTHSGNWHPLTWISHMTDCQIFGVNAGAHHLVNVFFHIANTLILFWFLNYTTRAKWRSAFVAAFFAWHPLHVESVAWAAERKDVLSTFFWLLTLIAYARFVTFSKVQSQKSKVFYILALLLFACGLMSKPMVVTLPFVLLLLDFWPLNRMANAEGGGRSLKQLFQEKIPFLFLSFALCALTFIAQHDAGAVTHIAWASRLGNIPVSYVRYISKTFWPTDMVIYYPYIHRWPAPAIAGSVLLLLLVSVLALGLMRQRAWLMVGWFWFLGTLVPVIGFVQAGMQSMADRYTYVPSIGLFILTVWGFYDLAQRRPEVMKYLAAISGVALAGCLLTTSIQLSYWQSNIKLFLHAADTTMDNYVALNSLGCALGEIGRKDDAIRIFQESIRIEPYYWPSQRNLAMAFLGNNQPDKAFKQFEVVLNQLPNDPSLRYELSIYLLEYKRIEAAKIQLETALQLKPAFSEAHELLGAIYLQQSQLEKAVPQFFQALKTNPNFAEAHLNLALAMEQQGKFHDAVIHLHEALRLAPDSSEIKTALDRILAAHPELKSKT
jgi:protein O-mannosyl-transferase